MNKQTTTLFVALACAFVLSTLIKPYPLSWAVKLLPILLLIGTTFKAISTTAQPNNTNKFFLFGLLFSACGDFLLDYNRDAWFIFGLGAFFVAHLCYLKSLAPFSTNHLGNKALPVLACYCIFGAFMFMQLAGGLGELFVPVLGYMGVLLLMALATVFSKKSNGWLILGGISFVISDSLIGFDKFNSPIFQSHVWVMISYYFAQFALVKGYLKALNTTP